MAEPTSEQRRELDQLVGSLCDGLLADTERTRLDEILHDNAWSRERYLSLMNLHGRLAWDCGFPSRNDDGLPQPSDSDVHKGRASWPIEFAKKIGANKQFLFAASLIVVGLIGTASGVMFSSRFVSLRPVPATTLWREPSLAPVQATLTRTVNVTWSGATRLPELGSPTGTHLMRLRSGRVQITFDTGVEVVVEGPAEFSQDGYGGMALNSGMLTAKVPARAEEFSVFTTSARIASRGGTDFGLVVPSDGLTELHVMEGTASAGLLTDSVGCAMQHRMQSVEEGHAIRLDRDSETIASIRCDNERFSTIRAHVLDIVDLVSGGDGFGDHLIFGIDAVSGRRLMPDLLPHPQQVGNTKYRSVVWNAFIDGVFVPPADKSPVQLDSTGRTYTGLPKTSGQCWEGGIALHRTGFEQPRVDDGKIGVYNWLQSQSPDAFAGTVGAFLGLHANVGITLDLRAIGMLVPNSNLDHFRARLMYLRPDGPGARPPVLWLFLDGRLYASYRPNGRRKPLDIDVPIDSANQMLTIIATDGDGVIDEDWIVLANPLITWVAEERNSI